ncbi:NADPH-dependent medium chain alcohol dehydrogenase [Geopyxis carbonaria]|nr:NADPH-dependent medium chain alcohol dehydrogenase [Geopyxis carbonaria]
MPSYPEKFTGLMVDGPESWSTFHKRQYTPKKLEDHDVDICIEACGVCGSDVHTITNGWGPATFPLIPGHEIIGTVTAVGSSVTTLKPGDRAGVGAQIWACLDCEQCKSANENYCPHQVDTYGARYPDGTLSQGGYASHIRAHEYFAFPIPEALPSAVAAPMLCAGLTTFSPLKRNGIGPGSKVAVVGLGGLGHFAVMWIKALGASAYVISHSPQKKQDALDLGAVEFIDSTQPDWATPWKLKFDMVLSCADIVAGFDMAAYLGTLKVHGKFWSVGLPDGALPEISPMTLAANGAFVGGSHLGNRQECLEMLQLAAEKGVKTWVQEIQVGEEGCKEAVERVKRNDVRYRFALVGFDKVFGDA